MSNKSRAWMTWLGAAIVGSLMGVAYSGPTLLYDMIIENTGCSAAQFGLIFSAIGIGLLSGSLLVGKAIEVNSKLFSIIGTFSVVIFYTTIALSSSIWIIIIGGFCYGVLFQFCGNSLLSALCTRWFNQGRGTVISMAFVMQSLFGVILNPVLAKLVVSFGGAKAALIIGFGFGGISLALMVFMVGRFPENYGMEAIDIGKSKKPSIGQKKDETVQAGGYECSLPTSRIILTPAFLMLAVSAFLLSMGSAIYTSNAMMLFQSMGLSYEKASLAMSVYGVAAMVTFFLSGVVIDKLGAQKGLSIFFVLAAVGCLTCPVLYGWTGAIVFAVFITCCGVWNMMASIALPKIFGVKRSSSLMGYINFSGSLCSIIVGPVATALYGMTGSYKIPIFIAGVGIVVATFCVWIALGDKMSYRVQAIERQYTEHGRIR